MTVKEIVKEYLIKNGYDGLCTEDCACTIDGLLNTPREFGCCAENCEPAYKYCIDFGDVCDSGCKYVNTTDCLMREVDSDIDDTCCFLLPEDLPFPCRREAQNAAE
jgi:hypothetical protein